jgi:predicted protein tyrosine phosphatase
MNFDIRVFGELELLALVESGEKLPDHLISIGNPRLPWKRGMPGEYLQPVFRSRFKKILRLAFFDVERIDLLGRMRPKRIPEPRDASRVLRFWDRARNGASGIAVHCWGGVSRSTAVALGLLYLDRGSEEEAGEILRAIRPQATPNLRIVGHFDAILGSRLSRVAESIRRDRLDALKMEVEAAMDGFLDELPAAE